MGTPAQKKECFYFFAQCDHGGGFTGAPGPAVVVKSVADLALLTAATRHAVLDSACVADDRCSKMAIDRLQVVGNVSFVSTLGFDGAQRRRHRKFLERLGTLSSVRHLAIDYADVDDEDLLSLAPFKSLSTLNFFNTRVNGTVLSRLENLTTVTSLAIRCSAVNEAGIEAISRLRELKALSVGNNVFGDSAARWLARITSLEELDVHRTGLSDRGLRIISALRSLERLGLSDLQITDKGCHDVRKLSRLKALSLSFSDVNHRLTDSCLRALSDLHSLEALTMNSTRITSQGLDHLLVLRMLRFLRIQDTAIDDWGVGKLSSLPRLERLWLDGTRVTDAGLRHLAKVESLRYLSLVRTLVTSDGIRKLRARIPAAKIDGP